LLAHWAAPSFAANRPTPLLNTRSSSAQLAPGPRAAGGTRLAFNFLPVSFDDGTIKAWTVPFESAGQLDTLRRRLADSHVVVKLNQSARIACVPFVPDAQVEGDPQTFGTSGPDLFIAAHLLQAALGRTMVSGARPFLLARFPPGKVAFVSRSRRRDLMAEAAEGVTGLEGLHVYPEYSLEVRRSGPLGQPGILVGLKGRFEIDWTVSDLLARRVDVAGRYVLVVSDNSPLRPFEDPARRRHLLGQVERVNGETLTVAGASGSVQVPASAVWPEPTRHNFLDLLEHLAGHQYQRVAGRLEQELFALTGAEGRMRYTHKYADWLVKLGPLTIADGVKATIGYPMGGEGSDTTVPSRPLTEPTFVFDLSGNKTNPYPGTGLNRFGPYDGEGFTPKSPRIAVLAPRRFQGRVEELITSFRDGIPDSAFARGFIRKFHLTGCDVTRVWFDGEVTDAAAYRQACRDLLAGPDRPHLAIVLVSEQQRHLTGNDSPYLVAKSMLMSEGVPVQVFRLEKMARPDLAHLLNTMSVACYAKLGGTPYVIKTVARPMAQELVIGMGSAHLSPSRMQPPDRYVGITTVFTADGHYRVSNVSREAPYGQYAAELLNALRTCIDDVKARNGWQTQDTIRLVFHVFKDLKDAEAQAVKTLVQSLTTEYAGVEFAFLHIIEDHDWMMYDLSSPGVGEGSRVKGKCVPVRGHAVPISRSQMLITTTGPREVKGATHGAPQPLLIQLHRESTFTDLDYLAGQVFRFSALSWRRLYPSRTPVTTVYSDLIARLLGQLRSVRNWNSDITSTKLRDSRWFL
jgi:hypothetical protein